MIKSGFRCGFEYLACEYAYLYLTQGGFEDIDDLFTPLMASRLTGDISLRHKKTTTEQRINALRHKDRAKEKTTMVRRNAAFLCGVFELPIESKQFLEFVLVLNSNAAFYSFLSALDSHDYLEQIGTLTCEILEISPDLVHEVITKLNADGFISGSTLLPILDLSIPKNLLNALKQTVLTSKEELLRSILVESPAPQFSLDQFPQVNIDLVESFFVGATLESQRGINLLLHGDVGTGKTEFARSLAHASGRTLFEVQALTVRNGSFEEESKNTRVSKQRLNYLLLLQKLLADAENTVLLIDECESVFYSSDEFYSKELLHRVLEQTKVPCIWITNYVELIEHSYIRRFSLVIEVAAPDKAFMLSMAKDLCKGLRVSEHFIKRLGSIKHLSPALIANGSHVAKTIGAKRQQAESVIEEVIENSLRACELWNDEISYTQQMEFEPEFLNFKQSAETLEQIRNAIEQGHPIRVLLCGPAGTGKTAFAHFMAETFQRDLMRVKCSDVLGKYVGESEKNIARIFKTAHKEKQLLLLDEVDSLLTSRERLQAQYETQLVNELLTQIECFTQPLFAATNFESSLDKAVLRRFDFKLECDYLTPEQVIALYKRVLQLKQLNSDEEHRLRMLRNLTPGDFAILSRRIQFQPHQNHRLSAIEVLAEENKRKSTTTTIGFVK